MQKSYKVTLIIVLTVITILLGLISFKLFFPSNTSGSNNKTDSSSLATKNYSVIFSININDRLEEKLKQSVKEYTKDGLIVGHLGHQGKYDDERVIDFLKEKHLSYVYLNDSTLKITPFKSEVDATSFIIETKKTNISNLLNSAYINY